MNPYHFAVIVGINDYPGIGNLTGAHGDAVDFRNWANDPAGGAVPSANTKFLLASLPAGATAAQAQPTADLIYQQFDETMELAARVPPTAWRDSRLYFYCAGHGIALDGTDSGLLAANVTVNTYGHHVSSGCLLEFFSRVQLFQDLVIFADCCRLRPTRTVHSRPPYWNHEDRINGPVRKYMAIGCLYGQQAFEETDKPLDDRRGYFTRALLSGLRGPQAALDPATKRITSTSLRDYINKHMQAATAGKFRAPLTADIRFEGSAEIFFDVTAAYSAPRKYSVTITISDSRVTGLELVDKTGTRLRAKRSPINPAEHTADLVTGLCEAIPIGIPPTPDPWIFSVVEGGGNVTF